MGAVLLLTFLAAVLAGVVYLGREEVGVAGAGMAILRTTGMGLLALALFNPGRARREVSADPIVLLDASLSMGTAGGSWDEALDTARSRAGAAGVILPFGSDQHLDSLEPALGASRVRGALAGVTARSAPVVVVTDGELTDVHGLPPALRARAEFVVIPRDTASHVALMDASVPARVRVGDSIMVEAVVGYWGLRGDSSSVEIDVRHGSRALATVGATLRGRDGSVRRRFPVPAEALEVGVQVLSVRVRAEVDDESRDNERLRVTTVSEQPGIVVIADPADVEARYVTRELATTAGAVAGFARVNAALWVDMMTLAPVSFPAVRQASLEARMVVFVGRPDTALASGGGGVWYWGAAGPATEFFDGEWYTTGELPASPLAGRLAGISWETLPPLTGVVPIVPGEDEWVGLSGRLSRRGADRPLLIGREEEDRRRLTTVASGWWRWALRGDEALEAYRSLVAAGTDWLLEWRRAGPDPTLTASTVVSQGTPLRFDWTGAQVPDSVAVMVSGSDSSETITLRPDARGTAFLSRPPGTYRWTAVPPVVGGGVAIVEAFSREFAPRPVTAVEQRGLGGYVVLVRYARETWWLFTLAILAFIGEWAWRQRRGLP